ncbi:MAG: hypothetical protein ACRBC3_12290 [Burkholderiaceae bacterium]
MSKTKLKATAAIAAGLNFLWMSAAAAQSGSSLDWSDRSRITAYIDEQRQLERDLLAVGKRAGYRAFIAKRGFVITAVNEDSAHKLEFEVVKDGRSHEVLLGFEREQGPADAIDVTTNIWLAANTARAMKEPRWKPGPVEFDQTRAAEVRDSNHLAEWTQRQEKLEQELPVGKTMSEYQQTLTAAGYRITAANESLPTHSEYELVKGKQTFELQIERDITTGRAISVTIAPNLWQAKETIQALE